MVKAEQRADEASKLKLLQAVTKKMQEIDSIMNEFAQNSTTMPAYRKKYQKLEETVASAQQQLLKDFVGRYEAMLASKESTKVVGKKVE